MALLLERILHSCYTSFFPAVPLFLFFFMMAVYEPFQRSAGLKEETHITPAFPAPNGRDKGASRATFLRSRTIEARDSQHAVQAKPSQP